MKKLIGILLVLCLLACAAVAEEPAQEEISPVGTWVLTAEGDVPAQIGAEKLLLLEGGKGVATNGGAMSVASWEVSDDKLLVTVGEKTTSYLLQEAEMLSDDAKVFSRQTDGSSCTGVWTLDRTYVEERGHDPEIFEMAYTLTLAEDGTGLFEGNGIESAAVTWILLEDGLHVHADGECMLFTVNGDSARANFASLDCALSFARTGSIAAAESAAAATSVVRTTGNVNLRAGAGKNNAVITTVDEGTELVYTGEKQADSRGVDWYKVIFEDNEAWVSSVYAVIVE